MDKSFRVRVFFESGPSEVLRGGLDLGRPYVVAREASGSGHAASPELRVYFPPHQLRIVNDGEADYELTVPMPPKRL